MLDFNLLPFPTEKEEAHEINMCVGVSPFNI
jgi:hypothetical protein